MREQVGAGPTGTSRLRALTDTYRELAERLRQGGGPVVEVQVA